MGGVEVSCAHFRELVGNRGKMLGSGYERVLKVFMYVCQLQSKDTSNHFTVKVYVDAMSLLLCSL